MERKIGELFQHGDTWLQCVEQPKKYDKTVCAICAFQGNGNCELDRCSGTYRNDKKSVIFKKLPKELPVGFEFIYQGRKLRVEEYYGCRGCAFEDTLQCGNPFGDVFECALEERWEAYNLPRYD